jgi:hypothetical protein
VFVIRTSVTRRRKAASMKEIFGERFRALKTSLQRHLKTINHIKMMNNMSTASKVDEKEEKRSKLIGRTIGGLVYHLVFNARPDNDLPFLISMVKKAGGDVGDINHSPTLVIRLSPEIAGVVEGRLMKYLGTRMAATGDLPPTNIMAGKATDKRDSRQLVGVLTYNPGGPSLFMAFFLGASKCPCGTGEHLTSSILSIVTPYLEPSQYCGFSGDGCISTMGYLPG